VLSFEYFKVSSKDVLTKTPVGLLECYTLMSMDIIAWTFTSDECHVVNALHALLIKVFSRR